jgi:hypothetical protein
LKNLQKSIGRLKSVVVLLSLAAAQLPAHRSTCQLGLDLRLLPLIVLMVAAATAL